MSGDLRLAALWGATRDAVRAGAQTYATLAAAFVLLPAMVSAVFGPASPRSLADLSGAVLAVQFGLAALGAVGQLAIARLVLAGGAPRVALAHGARRLPRLLVAGLLTALALVPALMLVQLAQRGVTAALLPGLVLLIPGLYAVARLALALPIVAARDDGPVAALRRSWAATAGHGWRVLGFLAALLALLVGVMLLASIVAAALGATLTLLAGPGLANFIVALVSAVVAAGYAAVNAVALAVLYRRLVAA